jgi:diguanylate cyclase (GGDEF)-like protein/hemerythrin-like metal-binding protein/PAS domain S-box-containing protein
MSQKMRRTSKKGSAVRQLTDDQETFHLGFRKAAIGIGLVDAQGRFFEVNDQLRKIFGIAKTQLLKMSVNDLPVPDGAKPAVNPDKIAWNSNLPIALPDKQFISKQGTVVWAEVTYCSARDSIEVPQFFIVCFHDITERRLVQIALERQATHDPLTKALNRQCFIDRANVELLRSGRHDYKISLVMADLDHFKKVNDTYGHVVGDHVLGVIGEIARSSLRMTDLLGRWGGEEFLFLLPDTGLSAAKRVSDRIRKSIERWNFPTKLRATASIGVALWHAGEDLVTLVDRADKAMYRAKQNGRNCVVVDTDDLRRESARKSRRFESLELHWRKAYACGVPEIDAEHKDLFRLANRIRIRLSSDRAAASISVMVDELMTHIANHFPHEEQKLRAAGYPEFKTHKQIHRRLLIQGNDLAIQFRTKRMTAGALLGFVTHDIVAKHMIQEDRKYYPWFQKAAQSNGQKAPKAN